MKHQDVYYYSDLLNDDFASAKITSKPLNPNFKYQSNNIFFKIWAFFIYYLIAKPYIFFYRKLVWRHKYVNKKIFKGVSGGFIYGNHTQSTADALIPMGIFRKRNYIIVNNDAFAIPGLNLILRGLGGVPLTDSIRQKKQLLNFIEKASQNSFITIYPEAHIWPYYTKIRPYLDQNFKYPAHFNRPVFTFTNCYTKRKFGKKPRLTTYFDGPFYPNLDLKINDRAHDLRELCYSAMCDRANRYSTYEMVQYIYKTKEATS